MESNLGFFSRVALAFSAFFAILGSVVFARGVLRLRGGGTAPANPPAEPPKAPAPPPPETKTPREELAAPQKPSAPDFTEALHVLSILQREGRLIDFLMEDLSQAADADIGAAARVVHEGCRKALVQYLTIEPVYRENEGATVHLSKGFDPSAVRLSGNLVGEPPFRGALRHHGWRVGDVRLPALPTTFDARILAPAEVELP
jgi:hypothetical protein